MGELNETASEILTRLVNVPVKAQSQVDDLTATAKQYAAIQLMLQIVSTAAVVGLFFCACKNVKK